MFELELVLETKLEVVVNEVTLVKGTFTVVTIFEVVDAVNIEVTILEAIDTIIEEVTILELVVKVVFELKSLLKMAFIDWHNIWLALSIVQHLYIPCVVFSVT